MNSNKKKISVLIPVYNNSQSLEELCLRTYDVFKKLDKFDLELVFVDDGSVDNSYLFLKDKKKQKFFENIDLKLIRLLKNYGANEAAKAGLKFCSGDAVIILPADLQGPPELIIELVKQWTYGDNLILCIRKSRQDNIFKIITANILYFFIRHLINKNYPKNGFDIFIADKKIYDHLKNCPKFTHIPFFLFSLGFEYQKIFFDRPKRDKGKSAWNIVKMIDVATSIFVLHSFKLIRFVTLFGIFVTLLSLCYSFVLLIYNIFYDFAYDGFSTVVILIILFGGIIVSILGIISEQLIRFIVRSDGMPETIIKEEDI